MRRPQFGNAIENRCEVSRAQIGLVDLDEFYLPVLKAAAAQECLRDLATRLVDGINADGGWPFVSDGFETFGSAEVDIREGCRRCDGFAEVRLAEVCPREVRPVEYDRVEVRGAEVRPDEDRPAEVCPAEVGRAEVCPVETRLAKVRAHLGMFSPPRIPLHDNSSDPVARCRI